MNWVFRGILYGLVFAAIVLLGSFVILLFIAHTSPLFGLILILVTMCIAFGLALTYPDK